VSTTSADVLQGIAGLRVERDVSLASYTTYRIGGPADAVAHPTSVELVTAVIRRATDEGVPWIALGLGSNVLVADSGFRGVVVRVGRGLDDIARSVDGDPSRWRIGAGVPTPRLARLTAAAGLQGLQRLVGVPGAVGGGVVMNAGAHGQDFSQVTEMVEVVAPDGSLRSVAGSALPWRYRDAGVPVGVVVAATVRLEDGDRRELEADIQRHFQWRKSGTPFNERCCGSVFRNPPADAVDPEGPRTAGQLIDAAGLKGFRVGDAQVSHKHANYIVNLGSATAADVRAVIDGVRDTVARVFGVELILEVKSIP
jgi:UDP-N-acetylmuramate dehydrogenase